MKQLRSVRNQPTEARSIPLIHWAAASSGAVIGSALALVAGSLWAAAAFSSRWAVCGEIVAPVGLWSAELVM